MLTPVGMAMLYRAFPPEERARASAVLIIPTVIAPALGPVLGGAIIDHTTWRWIFYINLPIGIIGIAFVALFLKEHREPRVGRENNQLVNRVGHSTECRGQSENA